MMRRTGGRRCRCENRRRKRGAGRRRVRETRRKIREPISFPKEAQSRVGDLRGSGPSCGRGKRERERETHTHTGSTLGKKKTFKNARARRVSLFFHALERAPFAHGPLQKLRVFAHAGVAVQLRLPEGAEPVHVHGVAREFETRRSGAACLVKSEPCQIPRRWNPAALGGSRAFFSLPRARGDVLSLSRERVARGDPPERKASDSSTLRPLCWTRVAARAFSFSRYPCVLLSRSVHRRRRALRGGARRGVCASLESRSRVARQVWSREAFFSRTSLQHPLTFAPRSASQRKGRFVCLDWRASRQATTRGRGATRRSSQRDDETTRERTRQCTPALGKRDDSLS